MHWLLLLSLLSSTTNLQGGGSTSTLNRLAENSIRQQLGGAQGVQVQITPGRNGARGDFDAFNVTLDGFAADRLMGLEDRVPQSTGHQGSRYPSYAAPAKQLDSSDLGTILGGMGGGDWGNVLGDILGGNSSSGGRIGRVRLNATNFTYQGVRYDSLAADLGEIRFDWGKALRGEFDIKSVSPGNLMLNLRGEQAQRLLAPRLPSVSDVRVRFQNGRAFVGANTNTYGLRVPFEVGARLSVQQNQVIARDFAASVAQVRLPAVVMNELTRGVNPLYDFDPNRRWPLAINLNTAQAENNVLGMRGGVQWVGFNRNQRREEPRYESDYEPAPQPRRNPRRNREQNNQSWEDVLGGVLGQGR